MSMVRFITSKLPSLGTSVAAPGNSLASSSSSASTGWSGSSGLSGQASASPLGPPSRLSTARAVGRSSSERAAAVSNSVEVLRIMRVNHSAVAAGSASRRVIASLPDRFTAMVRSALTAESGAIGSGSRIPPSASSRSSRVCGAINPGDRDGRADRLVQRPALKPHRLAGQQVGGHRGVGDAQVLDGHRPQDVAYCVQDLARPHHPGRADGRVQQLQDGALSQRLGPLGELVDPSGRLQAADQRAHRRAGDADDVVAAGLQRLDHPDVGVAAGATAAERECHPSRC